ncbi:aspartic peptidase domain-containing protein, partial [Blyttiomyces helicus]
PITTNPGYWKFDISAGKYEVGAASGSLSSSGLVTAAMSDTGSTLVSLPTDVTTAIWDETGATDDGTGDGTANIPCSVAKTGPDVYFTFSNKPYAVPAAVYVIDNGDGTCMSGFAGGAEHDGVSIFGDVFLREWYSLYDIEHKRIGFAKAHHP